MAEMMSQIHVRVAQRTVLALALVTAVGDTIVSDGDYVWNLDTAQRGMVMAMNLIVSWCYTVDMQPVHPVDLLHNLLGSETLVLVATYADFCFGVNIPSDIRFSLLLFLDERSNTWCIHKLTAAGSVPLTPAETDNLRLLAFIVWDDDETAGIARCLTPHELCDKLNGGYVYGTFYQWMEEEGNSMLIGGSVEPNEEPSDNDSDDSDTFELE